MFISQKHFICMSYGMPRYAIYNFAALREIAILDTVRLQLI